MPGEKIPLSVSAPARRLHSIDAPQGALVATGPNKWTWEAPVKPGLYPLKVKNPAGDTVADFSAFVMVPSKSRTPGRAERVSDRLLSRDAAEGQSDLHSAEGIHRGHQRQRRHESLAELPHQGIPHQAEKRLSEISRARRAAGVPTGSDRGASRAARAGTRATSSS